MVYFYPKISSMFRTSLVLFLVATFFQQCAYKFEEADLIVHNATIHSMDIGNTTEQAMAIKDGKIIDMGPNQEILNKYTATEQLDARLRHVYPGFNDAHCHFYGYGISLSQVDLVGTTSFEDVLSRVAKHHAEVPAAWILGRGWDQNDWSTKVFPNKKELDALYPTTPVFIKRVDGHAALANQAALDAAGILEGAELQGGLIESKDGELTGILIDNAMDSIQKIIPEPTFEEIKYALLYAQQHCLTVGLTSLTDAGLDKRIVEIIDSLHKTGDLKIRVYAMLSDTEENLEHYLKTGPYKTDRLSVRSFKFYGDGALGSRGAALRHSYSDAHNHFGTMLRDEAYYREYAQRLYDNDFQMNTHCIGDSANRTMLNIYTEVLGGINDRRWRIEHAQVVDSADFNLFGASSIVPSVQPTHCTSDMPWAQDRLGDDRIGNAYAYQSLFAQNGWLPLGTDFPVEDIDPLRTYCAAVFRKIDPDVTEGYLLDEALTREQALRGITIWAAMAAFEEHEKGTLEKGKLADFVVLDHNILDLTQEQVLKERVVSTYINGEKVFGY